VPNEKKNIDKAPRDALPAARANSCIVCRGPQGIKPFRSPTIKGDLKELPFAQNAGSRRLIFLKKLNPAKLKPITIMNIPAKICMPALAAMDMENIEPTAPTSPPRMV
jgi:hypothetical protein